MSTTDESSKKRKIVTIGTHNGRFHCDEAMACFMLKQLEEFQDAEIIRSRDKEVLNNLTCLVDVGGIYDHDALRYDHHQREFQETLVTEGKSYKTKLSSAGLIYKHYGHRLIKQMLDTDDEVTDIIFHKVYESFVEALDGIDNGVSQYPSEVEAAYKSSTDLPSRVGRLNPAWNEEDADEDALFVKAMEMVGAEFSETIMRFGKLWLPAREIVVKAIESRAEHSASGEILVLEQACPWKDHLVDLEKALGEKEDLFKYVLFPDKRQGWRIQAVPVKPDSFELRLGLPKAWRGMRDGDLDGVTGLPGGVFVHMNGFIGGHTTFEGALGMAQKSLEIAGGDQMSLE